MEFEGNPYQDVYSRNPASGGGAFGESEFSIKQVPPNDIEAEQAVLSCMLFDRDAIATAYERITAEDFYRPDNAAVYSAMIELFLKNVPVDAITLKNRLTENGVFDVAGGIEYISYLVSNYYSSVNIAHYIKIVEERSVLRRLIKAGNNIAGASYEGSDPVEIILDNAEKSIFNIIQKRNTTDFSHIEQVLQGSIRRIEEIYSSKGKLTGIETGFPDFDNYTAGLQRSDLVLVAARPSMGKTAFALNMAQHVAVRHNFPVAIFSLEMSKEQLATRLLCSEANIDSQKLRTGELTDKDWDNLFKAVESLAKAPLYIDDTPGITVNELRAKCRKMKLEKGLELVMVDYLQLMSGGARSNSRQEEISEISRSLKAVAREINAPLIALSQLSRACEARADHRPMLSDLRESGAIEQDADVVTFLYRDEYYNPENDDSRGKAELIIAKQRNGPTGTVQLAWIPQYTKFGSASK